MMKGIRIVSDGASLGTRVFANNGEDVTEKLHIREITWKVPAGGAPEAVLTCAVALLEAVCDATIKLEDR